MVVAVKKSGKKNRKYGRNATQCIQYYNLNRRMVNKISKVKRHIRHFPKDIQAINWLKHNT
jgi:hypothetical protein